MIDLHSHILPGIDDGSPDFETSVALVSELAAGGVTEVIATPHYIEETIYTSPRAANMKLLTGLRRHLKKAGIPVKVHLGNEIYITPKILELLKNREISPLGKASSKYLLVELPMNGKFPNYADIFLSLIRSGYKVVLAHPERYSSFAKDFSLISELCDMGVLMQCNLGSFAGIYGKTVLKLASRMAKEKMIFAFGSDIHHVRGGKWMGDAFKKLSKFYSDDELDDLFVKNPKTCI